MSPDRTAQIWEFQQMLHVGRLKRGMSRTEIRELLGKPSEVGGTSRKYQTPSIYKYDHVQFVFGPRASDGLLMVYSEGEAGEDPVYLLGSAAPVEE